MIEWRLTKISGDPSPRTKITGKTLFGLKGRSGHIESYYTRAH